MPDYPLLVFPEPTRSNRDRLGRFPRGTVVKYPSADRQSERLGPKLRRLEQALQNRRIALQDNPQGIEPEHVLVMEIVGSIADFYKAVTKIPGFEWLGEYESEPIDPDQEFYIEGEPSEQLTGQVFLVMADQLAQSELLNLYRRWVQDHNVKMRRGYQNFKHLFDKLHDIRPWNAADRIKRNRFAGRLGIAFEKTSTNLIFLSKSSCGTG